MKIGVDARPLTVPTFGIGRYTSELLERMINLPGDHQWYLYADRPLTMQLPDNVSIRQCQDHNRILSLGRTQFTFSHWARMDKLDVFWSPRHHLPMFLDMPQVVSIHDIVWKKFPGTMQKANWFVESLLMPMSIRHAKKIITVSESTKRDLISEFNVDESNVVVIYEAASEPLVETNPRELQEDYFLFLGTNEPRKNLHRLLQAHRLYQERGGAKQLVIVGAAGWGSQVSPQPGCQMLGYVDDTRLDGLMKHAHGLVMPSLYEGFGLPLLEAMQRSVPVIASSVSAMPEVVGEAGLLVDPLDVTAIATALAAMDDPATHERLRALCASQAAKFSWDVAAAETLRVISAQVL